MGDINVGEIANKNEEGGSEDNNIEIKDMETEF